MQYHNDKNGCLGPEVGMEIDCKGAWENFLRIMEMFQTLIAVMVTWLYTFTKTHQTVHLKWVIFII